MEGRTAAHVMANMGTSALISTMLQGAALLLVAYLFKTFFIYPFFLSPLRNLPGPPAGIPLFGQSIKLFATNNGPNSTLLEWSKKWSKEPFVKYLSIGNSEVLLVNNLAAHKEVMQSKVYSLVKPSFFKRLVGEITGVGLLFADGELHKKQRRLLANPFSAPNIKKLLPIFKDKAEDLASTFNKAIDETGEKSAVLERTSSISQLKMRHRLIQRSRRHLLQSHP